MNTIKQIHIGQYFKSVTNQGIKRQEFNLEDKLLLFNLDLFLDVNTFPNFKILF